MPRVPFRDHGLMRESAHSLQSTDESTDAARNVEEVLATAARRVLVGEARCVRRMEVSDWFRAINSPSRLAAQGRYGELCIEQRVFCLADAARERGFTVRTLVRVG